MSIISSDRCVSLVCLVGRYVYRLQSRVINALERRYYGHTIVFMGIVSFCAFFPGTFEDDSLWRWQQAIGGYYYNDQPVILTWWWGWMARHIWLHPAVLLVFHLLLFWSAVYILGRTLSTDSAIWPFLCVGIWFIPPIMGMTSALLIDSDMSCSWFLSCAIMFKYYFNRRRPNLLPAFVILLSLFYGTAARYNAFTGLPPLCFWFARCLHGQMARMAHVLATSLLICVGLLVAVHVFNPVNISSPNYESVLIQNRCTFDLVELSNETGINLMPPYLKFLCDEHVPLQCHWLSGFPLNKSVIATTDKDKSALFKSYFFMVWHYPAAYISYRWKVFSRYTCVRECRPYVSLVTAFPSRTDHWRVPDDLGTFTKDNEGVLRTWATEYLTAAWTGFWYADGVWLLVALALLAINVSSRTRGNRIMCSATMLSLSAVLYMLPYSIIMIGDSVTEFRYVYWALVATAVAVLISCFCIWQELTHYLMKRRALRSNCQSESNGCQLTIKEWSDGYSNRRGRCLL